MQISQQVRVRGARWRVANLRPCDDCEVVTLVGLTPPYVGIERRVLTPFDVVEPIDRPRRPVIVSGRRWRRACRALIAADTPPGSLRAARTARLDLMPHQLAPAIAVAGGLGCRVLLADAVGLGKTIQAGLIVAELRQRGWIERVLVLTPAGLRDQWVQELADRFGIEAVSVDAHALRRAAAVLPVGVNPWSTITTAVASIDYIKRPEVLPAVSSCAWDAVIVDEAHGSAGDSERHDALTALASRAPYVLLVTATPHNGDRRAFAALCDLGSLGGDPLVVFRRTRADIGMNDDRRVHTVSVRPSLDEQRMHAQLATFSNAVRGERAEAWLALSVLHKRALSSPWALRQSVERRLAALASTAAPDGDQLALPLGDPHGEFVAADEPPSWPADLHLADSDRERALLTSLATAAGRAGARETKLAALRRLLHRANESAIVFTEYRDTLLHVHRALHDLPVVVLHGGLTREERAAALTAFATVPRAVLLATDAAGEGLNLHHACRLVINLELPWNPMRLEQRIGRVHRIGQRRTVHAFHLVATGTGEMEILARLRARVTRAQADIGAPDPLGQGGPIDEERLVAHLIVTGQANEGLMQPFRAADQPSLFTPDLHDAACAEVTRVRLARAVTRSGDDRAVVPLEATGPWIVRARRRRLRRALASRSLLLWRIACEDACGRIVESRLVLIAAGAWPASSVERLATAVAARASDGVGDWRVRVERAIRAFASTRLSREHAIANHGRGSSAHTFQPGLFDRRAVRSRNTEAQTAADAERLAAERIAAIERATTIAFRPPELLLAIVPREAHMRVHPCEGGDVT